MRSWVALGWLGLGGLACGVGEPEKPEPGPLVDCEGVGADVSTVQLFDEVVEIRCSSCHQEGAAGGETALLFLTNPSQLQAAVGLPSMYAGEGGLKIVDPGKPENSSMLLKVFGGSPDFTGPDGELVGSKMPNTGLLPEAEREQFRRWICGGAD